MLIECTFCHAKAKIPDSKEGAKVRCGECGKVYVARDPSSRGRSKTSPTPFIIGGAAVVGALVILAIVNSQKGDEPPPVLAKTAEPEQPRLDLTGYDSAFVKVVRDVYEAAYVGNETKLKSLLQLERISDALRATPERADLPEFAQMSALERDDLANEVVATFLHGEGDAAIAAWKPHDGSVIAEGDELATIHVEVHGRADDTAFENRTMEWKLAKDARDQGKWKVYAWERYFSPDELKAKASARSRGITRVEFEGGGKLYQAEPKPIPHYEDTPPEQRKQIDDLVVKLIDFKLKPRENDAAGRDLVAIGKNSVPALLTKLYEIPLTDDTSLQKASKVYSTFRDITGYDPGFSPMGTDENSQAKREATIKACFAWFQRKGDRFEEKKEGVDLLETMIEPTERDRRQMEKDAAARKDP